MLVFLVSDLATTLKKSSLEFLKFCYLNKILKTFLLRGRAVWQLVRLITQRSLVQIQLPHPTFRISSVAEQVTVNHLVVGSNPTFGAKISDNDIKFNIIIGDFVVFSTYPMDISKDISPLVSKTKKIRNYLFNETYTI